MLTPDDLLARQARFWHMWHQRAHTGWAPPTWLRAFGLGAPMYAMDRYFCRLVDEARRTIPATVVWQPTQLVTPSGWLVLEEPAALPGNGPRLQTVGWYPEAHGVQVVGLTEEPAQGLWRLELLWAINPEHTLHETVTRMNQGRMGAPECDPEDPHHAARWFYTAINLMANKLTLVVRASFARGLRRRAAQDNIALPDVFRRVTLRRVEASRHEAGTADQARDWQWQWTVRGHWRHYQTGHVAYIERYLKGPVDKPLKPARTPFFQVAR